MIVLPTYRTNAHNCFANHCRHETKGMSVCLCGFAFGQFYHWIYYSNTFHKKNKLSDNQLSDR
jgi:hypothetical protein